MYSDHLTSAPNWCDDEFAHVNLADARLNSRCQSVAAAMAAQPNVPINQACEDWADTKAAYRFFDNDKVTAARILLPHKQRTMARMSQHALVLVVQDTSFLNYTHHPQTEGTGAIGTKKQQQSGFVMHSALALTTEGLPLGLVAQTIWARPVNQPSHTTAQCRQQPIEEKESYKWVQAFAEIIDLPLAETETITICDREADIYEMFALAAEKNAKLLVRANFDRTLIDETEQRLRAKVQKSALSGTLKVAIPPPRFSTPARGYSLCALYQSDAQTTLAT